MTLLRNILQIYRIYILHQGYCDRLDTSGSRAFSVAAPLLWNELPNYITSEQTLPYFETKLKTHLLQHTIECS